jgi:excisionase family DNA binding protein
MDSVDARIADALTHLAELFRERGAQPSASAEDRLLDAAEAATMLAVPESTLREMGRQGRFPTVKIGKKYTRFRLSDVQAAMRKTA